MYTTCYLVINQRGAVVKATRKRPTTKANEIAFKLSLAVPNQVFEKPQFEATIKVDPKVVSQPVITPDIQDNIAEVIKRQVGVGVTVRVEGMAMDQAEKPAIAESIGN